MTTTDYVRWFEDIDLTQIALVGGKGAHLGELSRLDGVRVPAGFCITTAAFAPDAPAIPRDIAAAITAAVLRLGDDVPCAVRSSATAEDSPAASFAGQHDSFLNVVGPAAILDHVRRCWASLASERAVAYRRRAGLDDGTARMAVIVQRMVQAEVAGVAFTADPITSNRTVTTIEATFGLGDALVSGRVTPDVFAVRDGAVVTTSIAGARPTLTGAQVVRLAQLARRIEAHFGRPQDIEWCLVGDDFHIVQSRPITTLFPSPEARDADRHVYLSVGHQQMMTDAMTPLGLSVFQLTAGRPMFDAGARLFVDVTDILAAPASCAAFVEGYERADPLTGAALRTIAERDFHLSRASSPSARAPAPPPAPIDADPAIVTALIARSEASIAAVTRDLASKSGPALLDFILADVQDMKRLLVEPQSRRATMAGIEATWWLDDRLEAWLGETHAADTLAQSAPHNVTSEMGLALLRVADVIRPHPDVIAFLRDVAGDDFLDRMGALAGGPASRDAIAAYLDTYGMRCAGEIDITRPRWRERPSTLLPILLGHVDSFEPGEAERRFARGLHQAATKEHELLERVRALPDGAHEAAEVKRMIDQLRTFIGYREYPKYGIVRRYDVYKRALMMEAARLVAAGVLARADDMFYLTFHELHDVVRTQRVDGDLVRRRKDAFASHRALTPPRVMTSEGEVITSAYRRDGVPDGALVGLPVSGGTVEGRARVVLDMADAGVEPGDILVTAYTDPSWTPLFVAVAGLVTEVGGLMTHGAVIAREYGLPAVVGVEHATRRIRDGQRIRVHGTAGYVELLSG